MIDGLLPPTDGIGNALVPTTANADPDKLIEREEPEMDEDRSALVKHWIDLVKRAKKFHADAFKRMKEDMEFAKGKQWGENADDSRYVANICQRHVQQRVSTLYAKNPKAVAKLRKRLDFQYWDGDAQSLLMAQQAMMMAQQTGQMPPPQAMMLLQEVEAVKAKRDMFRKVGQTAEILYQYYMSEDIPNFKMQAKQMIRRTIVTGVGYIKLGFHRAMQKSPDSIGKIADLNSRLAVLEQLSADVADGQIEEHQAQYEELELALQTLQSEPEQIVHEGLVFDFPKSNAVIIDPNCTQIKGFVGARWIAQEFMFTPDEIQQIYGVDVGKSAEIYHYPYAGGRQDSRGMEATGKLNGDQEGKCAVWEIQDKATGMVMTICDGYKDFLEEPASPKVKLQRFFNIFALSFNDIEDDKEIYPPSDVRLMRSMQIEFNRSREGLREHRIGNRPAYGGAKGVLEDEDKIKLQSHSINELIEFNVPPGTNLEGVIQPLKKAPIDPAVYDTSPIFDDVQKVVGAQQADFGGVSGVAATEVSVAEGARMATVSSNIDDLDDLLTELARCAGEIMLREVSPETAKKIAGDGAAWPELTGQDIADEIILEIEAGSSGRPNKAQEIANFERLAPTLLQIPGISPMWLAKQAIMRLDDTLDIDEAIMAGIPSAVAMNAAQQPSTGDPASDPNSQGGQGGGAGGQSGHNQGQAPSPQDAQTGGGRF